MLSWWGSWSAAVQAKRLGRKVIAVSLIALLIVIALASKSISEQWVLTTDASFLLRDAGQAALNADFDVAAVRAISEAASYAFDRKERDLEQAQDARAKAYAALEALHKTLDEYPPLASLEAQHLGLLKRQRETLARVDSDLQAAIELGPKPSAESLGLVLDRIAATQVSVADVRRAVAEHREREYAANELAIRGAARSAINTIVLNLLALLVLIAAVVFFTARYVVRPINALATAAGQVANGDLNQAVPITSKDEIGYLQSSFNRMVADLHLHHTTLLERNEELAQTIEHMSEAEGRLQLVLQAREEIAEQLRASRERLREFAASMNTQVESERRRIAHALHDELGQNLTALRMCLARVQRHTGSDAHAAAIVERAQQAVSDAAVAMRRIVADLRPLALDNFGLIAAAQSLVSDFAASANIDATLEGDSLPENLSDAHQTALYRALQEALNNVAKHARASKVRVRIECANEGVLLSVKDDGAGFVHNSSGKPGSYGLFGLAERAAQYGGYLTVSSAPGAGAEIKFWLPCVAEAPAAEVRMVASGGSFGR
jgi:signal transduction histidine kinase